MSETTKEKISRIVAEAVEARQHPCERCGHHGSRHAFDFVVTDNPNPCLLSCLDCMNDVD